MIPALQLFLLSPDPADPPARVRVDAAGCVDGRDRLAASTPAAVDSGTRRVLVVPGGDCRVLWLELPARNPVQALAAARLLVADQLAVAADNQHVAIGPVATEGHERLVVCVDAARMDDWLARAAAHGITPDAVVPASLLLPVPEDPESVTVAHHDDGWLVRGERLAFAAEPALAALIIGGRRQQPVDDLDATFAAGALALPVDLLQGPFARTPPRREGWLAWRRAAILAGLLAASPVLLLGARTIHHTRAADALDAQSRTLARTVLPALAATDAPLSTAREHLAGLHAGDTFARATVALADAVIAVDGAELDTLSFRDETLAATVAHRSPADIDRLREAAAASGLVLDATGSHNANGRTRTTIELGRQP